MNKTLLRKVVSIALAIEGFSHLTVPWISLYGMYRTGVWDWLIAFTPLIDLLLGFVCLTGSYLLGERHHHHH